MSDSSLPYRPCVGIMLQNANGLIFVGERIDTPEAWQMPQGGIDEGETPKEAALRELEEEIGVTPNDITVLRQTPNWVTYDLPDHLLGKVWGGKYKGQKQHWFLMRLNAEDSAINIETTHPEFSHWKWTTAEALIAEIVPFKKAVYEQVVSHLLP